MWPHPSARVLVNGGNWSYPDISWVLALHLHGHVDMAELQLGLKLKLHSRGNFSRQRRVSAEGRARAHREFEANAIRSYERAGASGGACACCLS